jgi:hypothetical protein
MLEHGKYERWAWEAWKKDERNLPSLSSLATGIMEDEVF